MTVAQVVVGVSPLCSCAEPALKPVTCELKSDAIPIAPPRYLRQLLLIFLVQFNAAKSKCAVRETPRKMKVAEFNSNVAFSLCGSLIKVVDSSTHLGHVIVPWLHVK